MLNMEAVGESKVNDDIQLKGAHGSADRRTFSRRVEWQMPTLTDKATRFPRLHCS